MVLQACYVHMQIFSENKTADHIQVALDQVLDDTSLNSEIPNAQQTKGQIWWLPQNLSAMLIVHVTVCQHQ